MELDISTLQTHEKITHYQGYGHITTRTAALSTTILEGDYEGERRVFELFEGDISPNELYDLVKNVHIKSNTGAIERRKLLRLYSTDILIRTYNHMVDLRIDPNNPIFSDIRYVLDNEKSANTVKIEQHSTEPKGQIYRYNERTGKSEGVIETIAWHKLALVNSHS